MWLERGIRGLRVRLTAYRYLTRGQLERGATERRQYRYTEPPMQADHDRYISGDPPNPLSHALSSYGVQRYRGPQLLPILFLFPVAVSRATLPHVLTAPPFPFRSFRSPRDHDIIGPLAALPYQLHPLLRDIPLPLLRYHHRVTHRRPSRLDIF